MQKILKSYGTDGAVAISRSAVLPDEGPVFIDIDGLPVPFYIESAVLKGGRIIVKFEDVDSLEEAEELAGKSFYLEGEDDGGDDDIIGMVICNPAGVEIGPITEFYDYPGNPCVEVDYNGRSVMLPLHEDLIKRVKGERIYLVIPDGLL